MTKKTKITLWSVGGAVVLIGGALVAASYYLFDMAVARDTNNFDIYAGEEEEEEAEDEFENIAELMERGEEWLSTQDAELLEQVTDDGLTLYGRYIANEEQTGKVALLLHGYRGESDQMGLAGAMYYEEGYDLFLPDARAHGESEGKYIGFGWPERIDQLNWLNKLIEEKGADQIVIHGESMGAATALMTAGEDALPQQVKAVIADSPYSSVDEELSHQMEQLFNIPSFPLLQMGSAITNIAAGYTFGEASASKQVESGTPPLFFIHGQEDELVPTHMSHDLYEKASTDLKEIWIVEGADHVGAKFAEPEDYEERVWSFINQHVE
ncbi:alpha/beta hydrolase [Shouchella sp. 1P09AA]|uniref:alpha/beta hydrolase n=1 Tax=unclassified Shouchella TaxID=2893065 RepID=UPI0039A3B281